MGRASDRYDELDGQYEESYSNRASTGRFRSIFKDEGSLKLWSPDKGEHELDIIPYFVGDFDPRVVAGRLKVGAPAYVLDLWVHRGVGVTEDNYICPVLNYRNPCPICEEIKRIKKREDFDEEVLKSLYPKRRVVYNTWVHDTPKEEEEGVRILEISHFFLERELIGLARKPREGGFVPFPHPVDGKTVFFDRTGVGGKSTKYERYQFLDRRQPIPQEILDQALCLDSLIYVPTYQELERAFFGGDGMGEEDSLTSGKDVPMSSSAPPLSFSPPSQKPPRALSCYGNGVLGKSFQQLSECGECPIWDDCEWELKKISSPPPVGGAPAQGFPPSPPPPSVGSRRGGAPVGVGRVRE